MGAGCSTKVTPVPEGLTEKRPETMPRQPLAVKPTLTIKATNHPNRPMGEPYHHQDQSVNPSSHSSHPSNGGSGIESSAVSTNWSPATPPMAAASPAPLMKALVSSRQRAPQTHMLLPAALRTFHIWPTIRVHAQNYAVAERALLEIGVMEGKVRLHRETLQAHESNHSLDQLDLQRKQLRKYQKNEFRIILDYIFHQVESQENQGYDDVERGMRKLPHFPIFLIANPVELSGDGVDFGVKCLRRSDIMPFHVKMLIDVSMIPLNETPAIPVVTVPSVLSATYTQSLCEADQKCRARITTARITAMRTITTVSGLAPTNPRHVSSVALLTPAGSSPSSFDGKSLISMCGRSSPPLLPARRLVVGRKDSIHVDTASLDLAHLAPSLVVSPSSPVSSLLPNLIHRNLLHLAQAGMMRKV